MEGIIMATITAENDILVLKTDTYNYQLHQQIKNIPSNERKWDANRKVWLVDPKHGRNLVAWVGVFMGENLSLPQTNTTITKPVTQIFQVRYIGTCKTRDDASSSAFGLVGNDWSLIFPETVLRAWFDVDQEVTEIQNLYQVLGVKRSASQEDIKSAFRRMVKQWHPDKCHEPNAHEMFIRIQEAHSILSDVNKRARYEAGLALEKAYEKQQAKVKNVVQMAGYRSPLRCGYIMVEGFQKLGRFEVSKILAWEDIIQNGKTLVVSWPMGAKEPVEAWA
jgi:hypothetical protein